MTDYAAIRLRPGMYIGGTGAAGVVRLVTGVFDEARGTVLRVELLADDTISIAWDAALAPDRIGIVQSPGMHTGDPLAIAHALTAAFEVAVVRDGWRFTIEIARGEVVTPLAEVPAGAPAALPDETRIVMRLDPLIFDRAVLPEVAIAVRLAEIAHLRGLAATLVDRRDPHAGDDVREFRGVAVPPDTGAPTPLERAVRDAPDDAALALVHADDLQARGDPRGELLAVEVALQAATDPIARDALDRRAATLLDHHRAHIWGRPGGFPFRERRRGRATLCISSDADELELFGGEGPHRVHDFLATFTDCTGPYQIETPVATPLARTLVALGHVAMPTARAGQQIWRRDPARTRIPAARANRELHAHLARTRAEAVMSYRFALATGGRLLPYQRAGWFADGLPLASGLVLTTGSGSQPGLEPDDFVRLDLRFPFERADDPAFVELRGAIEVSLGGLLHVVVVPPPP